MKTSLICLLTLATSLVHAGGEPIGSVIAKLTEKIPEANIREATCFSKTGGVKRARRGGINNELIPGIDTEACILVTFKSKFKRNSFVAVQGDKFVYKGYTVNVKDLGGIMTTRDLVGLSSETVELTADRLLMVGRSVTGACAGMYLPGFRTENMICQNNTIYLDFTARNESCDQAMLHENRVIEIDLHQLCKDDKSFDPATAKLYMNGKLIEKRTMP